MTSAFEASVMASLRFIAEAYARSVESRIASDVAYVASLDHRNQLLSHAAERILQYIEQRQPPV